MLIKNDFHFCIIRKYFVEIWLIIGRENFRSAKCQNFYWPKTAFVGHVNANQSKPEF